MNRYQKAFPIGTQVLAFTEEGMIPGVVTIHTVDEQEGNGLIVTFDEGGWMEYPYHLIDLEQPTNSYVIRDTEGIHA